MNNQNGNAVLLILPISIAVAVSASSFIMWYSSHTKLQAANRAGEEIQKMESTIKMTMMNSSACKRNLNASSFGTTLSNIGPNRQVRILKYNADGVSIGTLFASGTSYNGLKISKMSFTTPTKVDNAAANSYLSELKVVYKAGTAAAEREFTLPVYFVVKAGVLSDCMATNYVVEPDLTAGKKGVTKEDFACATAFTKADFFYSPELRTCGPKAPGPIASN